MGQDAFAYDREWILKFPADEDRAALADASGNRRRPAPRKSNAALNRTIPAGISLYSPDSAIDGFAGGAAGNNVAFEPALLQHRARAATLETSIERLFEELERGIDVLDRDVLAVIDRYPASG